MTMRSTIGMVGAVADRLRGVIHEICQQKGFEVHLFFSAPPAIAPSLAVQWFKGISARTLFERTEHVRTRR